MAVTPRVTLKCDNDRREPLLAQARLCDLIRGASAHGRLCIAGKIADGRPVRGRREWNLRHGGLWGPCRPQRNLMTLVDQSCSAMLDSVRTDSDSTSRCGT